VGTFLVQYKNQLHAYPHILSKVPPQAFLETYLKETKHSPQDFLADVELFKARTALSIIYYLVKVGLGQSEDLWRVLVSAEMSMTRFSAKQGS
jgi:3',5'-nucleoside bisphosphate phosphatase